MGKGETFRTLLGSPTPSARGVRTFLNHCLVNGHPSLRVFCLLRDDSTHSIQHYNPSTVCCTRHMVVWSGALIGGVANDVLFMVLPFVDNFWHAQAIVMLTPRYDSAQNTNGGHL